MADEQYKRDKIRARIESGQIAKNKAWKYIKELNSYSEERLDSAALIEGGKKYSYRKMFRMW